MAKGIYTQLIAPNGARIKIKDFKALSQEIRLCLVFKNPIHIKLDKSPFKEADADTAITGS